MILLGAFLLLLSLWVGWRYSPQSSLALAITIYALFPTKLSYTVGLYWIVPGALSLTFWSFRRKLRFISDVSPGVNQLLLLARFAAVSFVLYSTLIFIMNGGGELQTVWCLSFLPCVVLPLFARATSDDVNIVIKTWGALGGLLGIFCGFESILQYLPIYGQVYSTVGIESVQHWVTYRAEGSFGHPLIAATFLGTGAIAGFGNWIETREARWLFLAFGAVWGTAATLSRGGLFALAVGFAFLGLVALTRAGTRSVLNVSLWTLFAGAAVLIVGSGSLVDRIESSEAADSDYVRNSLYDSAWQIVQKNGGLGGGLGESDELLYRYNPVNFSLESSFWQLAVSTGLFGLLLVTIVLGCGLVHSIRGGERGLIVGPMLLCLLLSISTYPAIDQLRTQHCVIGILLVLCFATSGSGIERGSLPRKAGTVLRGVETQ